MTLAKFKKLCEANNKGGYKLPLDDSFSLLVNESIKNIAQDNRVLSLHLLTNDKKYEVLRVIDKENFIRYPKELINDDSLLDIDEGLISAVLYDFLAFNVVAKEDIALYLQKKEDVIHNFMWNNYQASKELLKDE